MISPETAEWHGKQTTWKRELSQKQNATHARVESHDGDHFFELSLVCPLGTIEDMSFNCPNITVPKAIGGYLQERLLGANIHNIRLTVDEINYALGSVPHQRSFYLWMGAEAVRKIQRQHNINC